MAAMKSLSFVLLLVALAAQSQVGQSSTNCSAGLAGLMTCAPYVVPPTPGPPISPSTECCTALRGVDHSCLCDTINIISRLPSSCKLPPVTCAP